MTRQLGNQFWQLAHGLAMLDYAYDDNHIAFLIRIFKSRLLLSKRGQSSETIKQFFDYSFSSFVKKKYFKDKKILDIATIFDLMDDSI